MFHDIIELDREWLLRINHLNAPWFDHFFWLVSSPFLPVVLGVGLCFFLFKEYRWQALWYLLFVGVTVAIADQISSDILKRCVHRLRPTHDPGLSAMVHIVHGTGGLYGFVSSHAANTFGVACFLSLLIRNRSLACILFFWATLTSYSRMYLGVHYPLDVLGGIAVGFFAGFAGYGLLLLTGKRVRTISLPVSLTKKSLRSFGFVAAAAFLMLIVISCFRAIY